MVMRPLCKREAAGSIPAGGSCTIQPVAVVEVITREDVIRLYGHWSWACPHCNSLLISALQEVVLRDRRKHLKAQHGLSERREDVLQYQVHGSEAHVDERLFEAQEAASSNLA